MNAKISAGDSFPIGANVTKEGTNFCLYSKNATAIELLLFEDKDSPRPYQVIRLDPEINKTFYYWHVFVEGVKHGQVYAYRAYGPYYPEKGKWFDGSKVLVDPYAKCIYPGMHYSRKAAIRPGDNCLHAMRSVVVDEQDYDWEGDKPVLHPYRKTVIYEMHVGGFTKDPSSGVTEEKRGTFAGLIEKIPYLQDLGITAVELLPVYQFDPYDAPKDKLNYWGYSPVNFFAPHNGYAMNTDDPTEVIKEFKDMVKALHKANIEVILDVVYNHTTEVSATGPTLNFRGLDANTYYILDQENDYQHLDYSGCGNTLNANNSIVRRMIMDSLRHWVSEMHVDGFRFDLASALYRDVGGEPLKNPPVLWEIESDPVLAGTKMIAEAWDAAGLYHVGNFIGDKWSEWNGVYRDASRKFIKGDGALAYNFAEVMEGSRKLFGDEAPRDANRSINFITCHDGFTMNDLVSYNQKHNLANGESNRDGSNDNFSWNSGIEGETRDPIVNDLRRKQIKNFLCTLLLAQGTPMISMGDEVRRTQNGNNNAYCQDNEISWFNWNDINTHKDIFEFSKKLIKYNLNRMVFQKETFWGIREGGKKPIISWHGIDFDKPDFDDHARTLSFMLTDTHYHEQIYLIFNAYWEPLEFEIPEPVVDTKHIEMCRIIDTSLDSPNDFIELEKAPVVSGFYNVPPRSVVVLEAR